MRFLIQFDKKLQQSPFQVQSDLNQSLQNLQLIISLTYNNMDQVYLQHKGSALLSKRAILSNLIPDKTEPILITVRPKDQLKRAGERLQSMRQNIETNLNVEGAKKVLSVVGIVLLMVFLFGMIS